MPNCEYLCQHQDTHLCIFTSTNHTNLGAIDREAVRTQDSYESTTGQQPRCEQWKGRGGNGAATKRIIQQHTPLNWGPPPHDVVYVILICKPLKWPQNKFKKLQSMESMTEKRYAETLEFMRAAGNSHYDEAVRLLIHLRR